jgi:hypothetical protein
MPLKDRTQEVQVVADTNNKEIKMFNKIKNFIRNIPANIKARVERHFETHKESYTIAITVGGALVCAALAAAAVLGWVAIMREWTGMSDVTAIRKEWVRLYEEIQEMQAKILA